MTVFRHKLLAGSVLGGLAAMAANAAPPVPAFKGVPTVVSGGAVITQGITANHDVIILTAPETVINWVPNDAAISATPINFLPSGGLVQYINEPASTANYTVFNRILPFDPTRAVAFNGTVQSQLTAGSIPTAGGSVWFYSPGGIIAGPNAVFDIGNLVLTSNDITVKGGLYDATGHIQFRGAGGSSAAVSIDPLATITASAPGSYVALVAPRVVQAGTINVNGSAALIAAEQVDVLINNGLFDIRFLAGTTDTNGVVHTGTTGGPAATATDPNHGVYLAAMPKNTAVTMLVGGNLGFNAVAAGVVNDTVVLTSGYDVAGGQPLFPTIGATPPSAIAISTSAAIPTTDFSSGLITHANGATSAISGAVGGLINFAGPAVLQGDASVKVTATQGSSITAQNNLSLIVSTGTDTGGQALLSADYNAGLAGAQSAVTVAGNLVLDASAFGSIGSALGGSAAVVANNGRIAVTGTTTLTSDAQGYGFVTTNGDGSGGQSSLRTNGVLSQLSLTGGVVISANGAGGTADTAGGAPAQAGNGTGGTAQLVNGGGAITTTNLTIQAVGKGGVGHVGGAAGAAGTGGVGTGGTAIADFSFGQTTFTLLSVNADGLGGDGLNGGGNNTPGIGGNGSGGLASLTLAAGGGTANGAGAAISANGVGGVGNTSKLVSPGSAGGSGTGGTAAISIASGSFTVAQPLIVTADGVGGVGGDGIGLNQTGGVGGTAIGGTALMTLTGGVLSVGSTNMSASAIGGGGGAGNGDSGAGGAATGGAITFVDSAGNDALGAINLLATARGGSAATSSFGTGGAGGTSTGGTASMTLSNAELVGSISLDTSALGGSGGDGIRGGNGGGATSAGGALLVVNGSPLTVSGITLSAQATGGSGGRGEITSGDGGTASGGTAQLTANAGAAVTDTQLLLNAAGFGGAGGIGTDHSILAGAGGRGGNGQGGTTALVLNSGSVTLNPSAMYVDTLDASGTGGLGGIGGLGAGQNLTIGQGGVGGSGGSGIGGTAMVSAQGASGILTLGNPLSLLAPAIGGAGGAGGANGSGSTTDFGALGGAGGSATGGTSSVVLTANANMAGPVAALLDSSGQAGDGGAGARGTIGGAGGNGGAATGGTASLSVDTASFNTATLIANAAAQSGTGGAGGDGSTKFASVINVATPQAGNGGQGGNVGDATGGVASIDARGGSITTTATSLFADATGGNAGLGGVALADMINTGAAGVLTANYLNGLARTGTVRAGGASINLADNVVNLPSTAALGIATVDATGISAAGDFYYVPTATIVGGVVTDFASNFTFNILETGGRASVGYATATGGGGLQFVNLTVNAQGGGDGSLVGGAPRGIYISSQTDPITVTGGTLLQSLFNPLQIAASGNGTFRAGALTASGNDIAITHTPQNPSGTALTIDATDASFSANGNIIASPGTIIKSAGDITLAANLGIIQFDRLAAAGNATITTNGGTIMGTRLTAGNAVLIGSSGVTLGTTAISGNAAITALNGPVVVTTDFGVAGSATVTGTSVTLNALGALNLSQPTATAGALIVNDAGVLSITGLASGTTIALASSDIIIDTGEGQVGTQGFTNSVSLTNSSTTRTFIGDSGATSGYQLSDAEAQRIFANSITFNAPIATTGLSLNTKPADLVIGTLTLKAGGQNVGAAGSLNFSTPGKVQAVGAVTFTNAGPANGLNITAGAAIELVPATGTLTVNDGKGALAGTLNLTAPDIIAASAPTIQAIITAPNGAALNDILGQNDGAVNDTGYFSANAIRFSVQNGLYIQNSGVDRAVNRSFAARRGLTVGAGGLSIATDSVNTRIFINGRQALATAVGRAFTTGLDFIPTVKIGSVGSLGTTIGQDNFDPSSTVNGCRIAAGPQCQTSFTDGTLSRDTVGKSTENSGFGPMGFTNLVELKDVVPLGYQPLIDDPVTGAGNDDLWSAQDDKKQKK